MRTVVISLISCALLSCASSPAPSPADGIRASDDRQLIERGRHLVHGPAHCVSCHGDSLSGGRRFDLGIVGTAVAPNITSDPVAGVGARSDDDLVRSLRYGISHSGRPLIPFMAFADLADRDLQAIISFLRTVPPVPDAAQPHDLSWFGSLAVNVLMQPQSPKATPPAEIPPERSAAYGHYLAHTVANCHGCHTRRSRLTGAFVGPPFAGGMELAEAGTTFTAPDLTASEGGLLRALNERQFVERFRMRARAPTQSPMPWTAYARMSDDELGAIYLYLKSLPSAAVTATARVASRLHRQRSDDGCASARTAGRRSASDEIVARIGVPSP